MSRAACTLSGIAPSSQTPSARRHSVAVLLSRWPAPAVAALLALAVRPAGAAGFGAPERVSRGLGFDAHAAINARGDAIVVWRPTDGSGARTRWRPAGGSFGPPPAAP